MKFGDNYLEELENFMYLCSVVNLQGGTDMGVKGQDICILHLIAMFTNIHLFNSNIKSVVLYGVETWRTTTIINKL